MVDEKGQDDKLLCVPLRDALWSDLRELHDIPPAFHAEIEQLVKVYDSASGASYGPFESS
jgi:inorganic pyrophosphatase